MDIEKTVGTNAGKVWKALNSGKKSATSIAKETKLKINEVHLAIGWLGREGNITATKKKTGIIYSLL